MPTSVTIRVPATSANLGPGFDCLGLALDIWATITLDTSSPPGADDAMASMALIAARRSFEKAGREPPENLSARCEGDIPIARGLGASAVARVGGVLAANVLTGAHTGSRLLDPEDLLAIAADLEGHADNAAPALFGGLQASVIEPGLPSPARAKRGRSLPSPAHGGGAGGEGSFRVLHVAVPLPNGLHAVLFVPDLHMPTRESRKLLPGHLSRADAVYNIGRAALLVAALAAGRFDLLDAATQDRLHQKPRSKLFPAMFPIFEAAKAAGAHCAYLSGGGSTICALASENQQGIADAMLEAARSRETPGRTIVTKPTDKGAEVVEAVG